MKIYVSSRLPKLITKTFIGNLFPKSFVFQHFLIPNFSGESFKRKHADKIKLPFAQEIKREVNSQIQETTLRVGMFSGCILDVSEAEIHSSTLTLLRYLGCEVIIPSNQNCCGALHVHSGDRKTSREFALKNMDEFESHNLDAIITNSAGCGAQLKEYHLLFSNSNSKFKKDCSNFESKIIDIMEFLSRYPKILKNMKWCKDEDTVLYDAPCHLIYAQQVDKNPRKLLNNLPGVKLVPLEESEWCCGSAGIYNLTQPELSAAVLKRKTKSIIKALNENLNVSSIVTGNPGCLYQIRAGLRSKNISLNVLHPVVYLANRLKKNES